MCGYTLVTQFTMPTPTQYGAITAAPAGHQQRASSVHDFGSMAAGRYLLAYCTGATTVGVPPDATISGCTEFDFYWHTCPAWTGVAFTVWNYKNACNGTDGISYVGAGNPTSGTIAAAIAASNGLFWQVDHYGGEMNLTMDFAAYVESWCEVFCVTGTPPNWSPQDGSPNATFSLYKKNYPSTPRICVSNICTTWTTVGSRAHVTFSLDNHNCNCWEGVTVGLTGATGISGGGTYNLGGLSSTTMTFDFDAATVGLNLTVTVASSFFSTVHIHIFLAPVITLVAGPSSFGPGTCGPRMTLAFTNSGNWTVKPTSMTISLTGGYTTILSGSGCTGTNPTTLDTTGKCTLNCNGGSCGSALRSAGFFLLSGPAHGSSTVTVALSESGVSYGSCSYAATF